MARNQLQKSIGGCGHVISDPADWPATTCARSAAYQKVHVNIYG
jgi:hypothetical protein